MIHIGTRDTYASTQSPSISTATPSPTHILAMAQNPPRPWKNLGAVRMVRPLHQLTTHLEKWLPKFNPDNGILFEEHIHNFMLSINLNEVEEEDAIVILFRYTLQGVVSTSITSLMLQLLGLPTLLLLTQ